MKRIVGDMTYEVRLHNDSVEHIRKAKTKETLRRQRNGKVCGDLCNSS